MSKVTLNLSRNEDIGSVDIYKSEKAILAHDLGQPIVSGHMGITYVDTDIEVGKKYNYAIGYRYNDIYYVSDSHRVYAAKNDNYLSFTKILYNCDRYHLSPNHNSSVTVSPMLVPTLYGNIKHVSPYKNESRSSFYYNRVSQYTNDGSKITSLLNNPLGTEDFTVEMICAPDWNRSDYYARYFVIGNHSAVDGQGLWIERNYVYGNFNFVIYGGGTTRTIPYNGNIESHKYSVITVTRKDGVFHLFVNGTLIGQLSGYENINYVNTDVHIMGNPSGGEVMGGILDSFRITRGVARYTSSYIPEPFAQGANDPYFDYVDLLIDFDGDSGKTITDKSKYGKAVNIQNNGVVLKKQPYETSLIHFDGSSAYNFEQYSLPQLDDFTIEFTFIAGWYSSSNWQTIISSGEFSGNGHMKMCISGEAENKFYAQLYWNGWITLAAVNLQKNHLPKHVIMTRKDGVFNVYLDGVRVAEVTDRTTYEMGSRVYIGRNSYIYSPECFSGALSSIRITDKCRYTGSTVPIPTEFYPID